MPLYSIEALSSGHILACQHHCTAEDEGLHNRGVGVELRHRGAAEPLHPRLHPAVCCEVVCQREDYPQPMLA